MTDESSTRVLVVDNDVSLGEAIKYILEVLDFQVTTSSRAVEALELLKKGMFGVVIVDLSLGGMNNGSQLLEALRIHGNQTPALVFAPAGTSPDPAVMKRLGVVGVLPKPMDPSAVKRVVQQVLRPAPTPPPAPPAPPAPPPIVPVAAVAHAVQMQANAPSPATPRARIAPAAPLTTPIASPAPPFVPPKPPSVAAPRPPTAAAPRAPAAPAAPAASAAPQRPVTLIAPNRSAAPQPPGPPRPPPRPPAAGPDFYLPPELVAQPITPPVAHLPQTSQAPNAASAQMSQASQASQAPNARTVRAPTPLTTQVPNPFSSVEPPGMYISAAAPAPTPSAPSVREIQVMTQQPAFKELRVESFAPYDGVNRSQAPTAAASQAPVPAARAPLPTLLGTGAEAAMKLGRYIVQSTIASGGMGIVYRALDPHLERIVAIKVLKPTQGDQKQVEFFAGFVARFRREAVALAKLRHPNIVGVYDYGLDEPTGMAYVVMELVQGESLGALIEKQQKLPYAVAMSVIVQMAEALASAHELGIVHRDIKPENVILETGNRVRLIDFGMARMAESTGKSAEHLLGSPNYLSPELAEAKAVDWRADQFSLATVLLEMLSGKKVFRGDRILQTVNNVSTRPTPSFRELGIFGTPRELETLVMKMHQKFPSRRVQDERELVGDLRALSTMAS